MSLEKFYIILDVDGVTRRGVAEIADPKVMEQVNTIVACPHFANGESKLAFVSGSQILSGAADVGEWRGPNVGLMEAFKPFLPTSLIASGKCSVYGQLGADRIDVNAQTGELEGKIEDGYNVEACVFGMKVMFEAFLDDVVSVAEERGFDLAVVDEARALLHKTLHDKQWEQIAKESQYLTRTPDVMAPLALFIREKIDPHFRIVLNGALVEMHHSVTEMPQPAKTARPVAEVSAKISEAVKATKMLAESVEEVTGGIAHRGQDLQFRYHLLNFTTKGKTVSQFKAKYPDHTVITIGDGHIDFSMHRIANFSFHVGPKSVWETEREKQATRIDILTHEEKAELELKSPGSTGGVKHVAMITCGGEQQKDMQLTEGTVAVLTALHQVLSDEAIPAGEKHIDQVLKILGTRVNYE